MQQHNSIASRRVVNRVVRFFNAVHRVNGLFTLMFHPAARMPDSDGDSLIDTYLIPMDEPARRSTLSAMPGKPLLGEAARILKGSRTESPEPDSQDTDQLSDVNNQLADRRPILHMQLLGSQIPTAWLGCAMTIQIRPGTAMQGPVADICPTGSQQFIDPVIDPEAMLNPYQPVIRPQPRRLVKKPVPV